MRTPKRKPTTSITKSSKKSKTTIGGDRSNYINIFKNSATKLCSADDSILPSIIPLLPFIKSLVEKLEELERGQDLDNQTTTNAEIDTGNTLKVEGTDILQFWLRTLLDLEDIKKAWELFSLTSTIKAHFLKYDKRAEYLLGTDSIEKNSAELPTEVIASTKLGRHFTTRSLANEFKTWKIENEDGVKDDFIRSVVCVLPPGVKSSLKYEDDVKRMVAGLKRGCMAIDLETVAENRAISIFMAWNQWQFEHSVGKKGMKLCVTILEDDPRLQKVSELLGQWDEQIDPVQETVNAVVNRTADYAIRVSGTPAAISNTPQQTPTETFSPRNLPGQPGATTEDVQTPQCTIDLGVRGHDGLEEHGKQGRVSPVNPYLDVPDGYFDLVGGWDADWNILLNSPIISRP